MENELIAPLLRRKNQLAAEIKKIDDLLALYEIKPNIEKYIDDISHEINEKAIILPRSQESRETRPYNAGIRRKVREISANIIKIKNHAVPIDEIAEELNKNGYSLDNNYISNCLSVSNDFINERGKGWNLIASIEL